MPHNLQWNHKKTVKKKPTTICANENSSCFVTIQKKKKLQIELRVYDHIVLIFVIDLLCSPLNLQCASTARISVQHFYNLSLFDVSPIKLIWYFYSR